MFIEYKCVINRKYIINNISPINYNYMTIDNKLYGSGNNKYKYYHHSPLQHGVDDIEFIRYYLGT